MTLLLIGLNHKTAPIALRERLQLSTETSQSLMIQLHNQADYIEEIVILSTCNRFEIYAHVTDSELAQQDLMRFLSSFYAITKSGLIKHLYIYEDEATIRHLMQVASGLDSMVLGEAQILGQVNQALDHATHAKTTGTYLHRLFEAAIHTGKRARTETAISQHTTSISHAAALLMMEKVKHSDPNVLVLGAGTMAELAVYAIHKHALSHIAIINRTHKKALALANKFGVTAYPWSDLSAQIQKADVVITATGAPHSIINKTLLTQARRQQYKRDLLLIDIALPRNIAPDVTQLEGITLYDIDALQHIVDDNVSARQACIPDVNRIIDEEVTRYLNWLNERTIVPIIRDLRREVASVVSDEVDAALRKMPNISDADIAVVRRMAHRITNKILHKPTTNLRSHTADSQSDIYATVLSDLFALNTTQDDYPESESGI